MDVVQRREHVRVGSHRALDGAVEDLPAASAVLAVPCMGSPPVKPAEVAEQREDVGRLRERVVVVREQAPREDAVPVRGEDVDEIARECVHALAAPADVGAVLVARGGDVELEVTEVRAVRR